MAAAEAVWLTHPKVVPCTPWPCPADAVDGWKELGWVPTDERPVFVNPVTAEMPREMFEPVPGPKPAKPTKSTAKADASAEGSD